MPDTDAILAFLEEPHRVLATELDAFAARELAPRAESPDDDAARVEARALLRALGASGHMACIEREDLRACCLAREAIAGASPLADAIFALQALGTTPLLLAGDDATRARWVGAAVRGEAMAAFAMTEPEAGSDVAAITTSAVRDGGDYRIRGRKTFISNAGIADFHVVFARTGPDTGKRGLSAFVVPADAPGLVFAGAQTLSAPHPLGELVFDECRVPANARLGAEGDGWRIGMATLDRLRPTVGAAACGMASRALEEATHHARTREQFGQPLAQFQLVQEKLGRMAIDLAAARLLVYRAAWRKDRGAQRITVEAAMAKAFATEAAQRVVDEAVQILGGRGVLAASPVDRLYRAVRTLRIYEGTTEIQRLIVAGHLLRGRGDSAGSSA